MSAKTFTLDWFVEEVVPAMLSKLPAKVNDRAVRDFVSVLTSMSSQDEEGRRVLIASDAREAVLRFSESVQSRDAGYFFTPRGLRVDKIVDIETFVKSSEYLGLRQSVRPRIMEELWKLFHSDQSEAYIEVVLGGALGIGKSFFAEVATAYILYKLSCYASPQLEYKLAPGSSIFFSMQSVRLEQAKKVLFDQFAARLRQSPYFLKNFMFDPKITSELRFPNNITILPLSSSDTAALGLNLYTSILDELNFMAMVEDSVRASKGTDGAEYDQAEKLYLTALRRMKTRFQHAGKVPGKIFLISSANYPDDFIDRKCKEAELLERTKRPQTIFVMKMSQWEAFPPGHFGEETFFVEVGDSTKRSRILASMEDAIDPADVIRPPMEFYDDFHRDLEAAIRDLAGIPVGGTNSFIKQRETIFEAAEAFTERYGSGQLFTRERVDLFTVGENIASLVSDSYLEMDLDPTMLYVAHVDLALTGDSAGVAVAHLDGMVSVDKTVNWDEGSGRYVETPAGQYPRVVVDGVLEILPPAADEIDINQVAELLSVVASRVNLRYVTSDRYQSAALLQKMRRQKNLFGKRVKASVLSVDVTLSPYAETKQALRDHRLLFPDIEKLKRELRELQLLAKKRKVDHPPAGSKDLSDCVAGVVYCISVLRGKKSRRFKPQEETQEDGVRKLRIRRLH